MRKGALAAVLVAALAGLVLSGLSTAQHFRIQREGVSESSYCSVSEKIDCDVVNASSYAELLGVPIAWWGFVFYLLIGGMAASALRPGKDGRPAVTVAWLMSVASLGYCAFLAYISLFVLGVVCLECMGMYAVSIAFAVALFLALGIPLRIAPAFVRDYFLAALGRESGLGFGPRLPQHALLAGLVFLAGWGAIAGVQAGQRPKKAKTPEEKLADFHKSPQRELPVDPGWPVWGAPGARTVIVEYSDLQCPACRRAAFKVKPRLQEFRRDLRIHFVHYPLDKSCNPKLKGTRHPLACFAALAALCAAERGDFWSFHDELFRGQKKLGRKFVLGLAGERGWDREAFLGCMMSEKTKRRLRRDIESAERLEIGGTPTIFLNGRELKHWSDAEFLRRAVRSEIARQGGRS